MARLGGRFCVLLALVVLAGCGGAERAAVAPTATPEVPGAEELPAVEPAAGLAIGITEQNANFVWPAAAKDLPEPFASWRAVLERMAPHRIRLVVDWPLLQPSADTPANLDHAMDGCVRGIGPCLAYGGIREQLRAVAAAQRAQPGRWQAMVMISGTPAWAAASLSEGGCIRGGPQLRSRPPSEAAMPAYRQLIADIAAAARAEGAQLTHWSAWNEPNHPYFLAPQRERCDEAAPTQAVAPYARLVRELRAALAAAPGEQHLALGELAGYVEPAGTHTTVGEFIAALPRDVVCASTVWSQHSYVEGPEGGPDVAGAAIAALDARGCPRRHEVWITETGVGAPRRGPDPERGTAAECREMHLRLQSWHAQPRVTAAYQYTLREDNLYPTGLVTTDLSRAYGVLDVWTAWAGAREPADPPPVAPC